MNLLMMEEKVSANKDSDEAVGLVFHDFSKVFEFVNHFFLVPMPRAYGIKDDIVAWIEPFLNDSLFNVSVNGSISSSKVAVSAVLEDLCLAPSLSLFKFTTFLVCCKEMLLFIEDVTLISARANFEDLQRLRPYAWDWALTLDLPFNPNKCGHTSVGSALTRPLLSIIWSVISVWLLE